MKIIFVIPPCDRENLGILGLVTFLEKAGFKVEVIESICRDLEKELRKDEKVILSYYTLTVYYKFLLALNRKLKSRFPRIISLFGGPHPTFFPEMIEEEGVDGVCIGEGEYALLELVKNLREGKPITNIQNWWIKEDGKIYKNPLRPLIEDLDSLPFPDRSYSKDIISFKMGRASVMTSRGCPYQCSYCFNHAYNRLYNNPSGRVRRRSVDNVIEEIREIKNNYHAKMILFQDDNFILDKEWLREFSDKYKREVGLFFSCFVRADLIDEDTVGCLKNSGCIRVVMGIECGNNHSLNYTLKRHMDIDTILAASEIIKSSGINLRTANILGLPGSSLEADLDTLGLNIKCKADYARAAILSAYPRTDVYALCERLNLIDYSLGSTTSGANWSLKRKYKNAGEKKRLENLSAIFPLAVRFSFISRYIRLLIELPLTKVFSVIGLSYFLYELYFSKNQRLNQQSLFKRIISRMYLLKNIWRLHTHSFRIDTGP